MTTDPRELCGWRLYDRQAHAAAAEVFRWLQEEHGDKYDLRFRIYLDDAGYSEVWMQAVSDETYMYRTLTRWMPDGNFYLVPEVNNLMAWMSHPGKVGTADLWEECGRRFIDAYNGYSD